MIGHELILIGFGTILLQHATGEGAASWVLSSGRKVGAELQGQLKGQAGA